MLNLRDLTTYHVGPVNLTVGRGECVAISGASGSGKSLFLRAIADLDPNGGTVLLADKDRSIVPADQWRSDVVLVPAESGWWADRVSDHFDNPDEAAQLAAAVGLSDAMQWDVARLSSGERHRLAIVRALCLQPKVLMLDEPAATLDEQATRQVEKLLMSRLLQGMAMIVVTHDADQPARLNAQRFVMENGCLTAAPGGVQ